MENAVPPCPLLARAHLYKITPSCVIHSKPINYDIRETKTGTVNQVFNEQAKIKIERKRFEFHIHFFTKCLTLRNGL